VLKGVRCTPVDRHRYADRSDAKTLGYRDYQTERSSIEHRPLDTAEVHDVLLSRRPKGGSPEIRSGRWPRCGLDTRDSWVSRGHRQGSVNGSPDRVEGESTATQSRNKRHLHARVDLSVRATNPAELDLGVIGQECRHEEVRTRYRDAGGVPSAHYRLRIVSIVGAAHN
jgi:hypothetical protein